MSDGMYRAAFTALYERSRAMYPQIERKWGTPEIDDWCELMRNLMRAEEVPVEIPGDGDGVARVPRVRFARVQGRPVRGALGRVHRAVREVEVVLPEVERSWCWRRQRSGADWCGT